MIKVESISLVTGIVFLASFIGLVTKVNEHNIRKLPVPVAFKYIPADH